MSVVWPGNLLIDDYGVGWLHPVQDSITPVADWWFAQIAAAISYDNIPTTGPMWLPYCMAVPMWYTNSLYQSITPGNMDMLDQQGEYEPYYAVITNGSPGNLHARITINMEVLDVPAGITTGVTGRPKSEVEVLKIRYDIKTFYSGGLDNVSLFQFMHPHPRSETTETAYGLYSASLKTMAFHGDNVAGGLVIGMTGEADPLAHGFGPYAGAGSGKPAGIVDDIEADMLNDLDEAEPGEIGGALKFDVGRIEQGQTVSVTVYVWLARPGLLLRDILRDLAPKVGLSLVSDADFDDATQSVEGFVIGSRDSVRSLIDPLLRVYLTDLTEVDGKIVAVRRGGDPVATIAEADLGAAVGSGAPPPTVETARQQDVELPRRVDVTYSSSDSLYEQATQGAVRQSVETSDELVTLNTAITMTDDHARQAAESLLYDEWLKRTGYLLRLPPKHLALAPADVIYVPTAMGLKRARIIGNELPPFGAIAVKAAGDDAGVVAQYAKGMTPEHGGPEVYEAGATLGRVWNGNALVDENADLLGIYLGMCGERDDWRGCEVYMSRDGGASYQSIAEMLDPVVYGTASTILQAPEHLSTGLWDNTRTVDVTLQRGILTSRSEAEVLAGDNTAILGDEVFRFATVEALGGGSYRLSKLLRGRRGTDFAWGDHTDHDTFMLLEYGSIQRVLMPDDLLNRTVLIKPVTVDMTIEEVTAVPLVITGAEFKCYSPCHVAGSRDGSQNLAITWVRRSRMASTLRDGTDIPLSETTEAYEVDILDGATVVRTLTSSTPTVTYTAANQVTDFGSAQPSVAIAVYQIGTYGRGYAASATV